MGEKRLALIDRAIKTHIIMSNHGLPRLGSGGIVVEIVHAFVRAPRK